MSDKSASELIAEAKTRIREVPVADVRQMRARKDPVTIIDVREPKEWNLGRIPGALHVPLGLLETTIEAAVPRDRQVVLYCARGNRSALAADSLQKMGYGSVASMAGGWMAWAQEGGEVEE